MPLSLSQTSACNQADVHACSIVADISSTFAVFALVLLRLVIGWHFFREGHGEGRVRPRTTASCGSTFSAERFSDAAPRGRWPSYYHVAGARRPRLARAAGRAAAECAADCRASGRAGQVEGRLQAPPRRSGEEGRDRAGRVSAVRAVSRLGRTNRRRLARRR